MGRAKHLRFILNKISEINVALLQCESNTVLKIPNTVVNTYQVDDCGYVYLFSPRPYQLLNQFEKEFLVGLNYFKKGSGQFLKVEGYARIIDDPEELYCYNLSDKDLTKALNDKMLIKVKILKADYFSNSSTTQTIASRFSGFFSNLFESVGRGATILNFKRKPQQIHNFGVKAWSLRNLFPKMEFFQ